LKGYLTREEKLEEMINAYKIFVRKPQRTYLKDVGWRSVDWLRMTQDRGQWRAISNTVMSL